MNMELGFALPLGALLGKDLPSKRNSDYAGFIHDTGTQREPSPAHTNTGTLDQPVVYMTNTNAPQQARSVESSGVSMEIATASQGLSGTTVMIPQQEQPKLRSAAMQQVPFGESLQGNELMSIENDEDAIREQPITPQISPNILPLRDCTNILPSQGLNWNPVQVNDKLKDSRSD